MVPDKDGVTRVGEVDRTIAPVPVGVVAVDMAKVPEDVIGEPVTVRIDGTARAIEVTVPVVGVVHVNGDNPPDVRTCPLVPNEDGNIHL